MGKHGPIYLKCRFLEYTMHHNFVDFFLNCGIALGNKVINKRHQKYQVRRIR